MPPTSEAGLAPAGCARWGSGSQPFVKKFSNHQRLVSLRIAGSIEQSQRLLPSQFDQLIEQDLLRRQLEFGSVAEAKLIPAIGAVRKPLPQLGRGSQISHPEVAAQVLLPDPSRPDPVDQNRCARSWLPPVDALDTDSGRHLRPNCTKAAPALPTLIKWRPGLWPCADRASWRLPRANRHRPQPRSGGDATMSDQAISQEPSSQLGP